MYKDIKKESRTKRYFIDAVTGAASPEDSQYFSQGLSLIGVYFDTPYLITSNVLAEPYLDINLEDDIGITTDVILKPEKEDDTGLEILDLILDRTSMGVYYGDNVLTTEDKKEIEQAKALTKYIIPKKMEDDSPDKMLTLFFSDGSVDYQKFKMLGNDYHLFTLDETGRIGEEDYKHSLYILLKDKTSSQETFFSALANKKLNKRVTERVLESISQTNITGMFVGGASVHTKELKSTTYAISSTGIEVKDDEHIIIRTIDSIIQFDKSDIDSSEVEPNKGGKYTYKIYLNEGTTVFIYIG